MNIENLSKEEQIKIARRIGTDPKILDKLAKIKDWDLRVIIASNPSTPVKTLKRLDNYKRRRVEIDNEIAQNPNTPGEILISLAYYYQDEGYYKDVIKENIAKNPNTPEEALELLAKDSNRKIRRAVALNPSVTPQVLKYLLKKHFHDFHKYDYKNFRLDCESLLELLEEDYWLLLSPSMPTEVLSKCLKNATTEEKNLIAVNVNTHPEDLRFLEKSGYFRAILQNENTPQDILSQYAKHDNDEIRFWVAQNPNTPPDVLEKLLKHDEYSRVMEKAASNPSTPLESVLLMAEADYEDEDYIKEDIKHNAAKNPNIPIEVLEKWAISDCRILRIGVSNNPSTPDYILELLGERDKDVVVLRNVAIHPNTPRPTKNAISKAKEWLP